MGPPSNGSNPFTPIQIFASSSVGHHPFKWEHEFNSHSAGFIFFIAVWLQIKPRWTSINTIRNFTLNFDRNIQPHMRITFNCRNECETIKRVTRILGYYIEPLKNLLNIKPIYKYYHTMIDLDYVSTMSQEHALCFSYMKIY